MLVWKSNIPLKVKIFVWMAAHDRIQCEVCCPTEKEKNDQGKRTVLFAVAQRLHITFFFNAPLLCFFGPSLEIVLVGTNPQFVVIRFLEKLLIVI
jgi:hypothetical protein